ncbi:MAG TPA: hypothetical protein VK449_07080, partial [Anaerolineales bacterium]|nr:hypothetical protein [Anaerolineales bacterium]
MSDLNPSSEALPAAGTLFDLEGYNGSAFLEALASQPRVTLLWGTQAPTRALLGAATAIAAGGQSVRLFDGGNSFDGYFVARLARRLALASARSSSGESAPTGNQAPWRSRLTDPRPGGNPTRSPAEDPYDILDRMHLSRAFTCFQLAELIENAPAGPEPLFVLDLLATFYDESVPLRDSERLLATTLA